MPAVIEADARDRIEAAVAGAGAVSKPCAGSTRCPTPSGFFVAPTLVVGPAAGERDRHRGGVRPGPDDRDRAERGPRPRLVEGQRHALTGGLFSRNPRTIEAVARRTPVGNMYVNRGTTGAMVGRQPFGGNRMSGTGSKAGGPEYLLQFVEPVVVTENTTRHGIAT